MLWYHRYRSSLFIHSLDFYIFKKISLFTAPICWDGCGCGCGQFYETMSESLYEYDIVGILFMHDMVIYAMYGMIYSPSRSDQVQEVVVWEGSHDVFFFFFSVIPYVSVGVIVK